MELRYAFVGLLLATSTILSGQQVEWLNSAPVEWDLNPYMPSHSIRASRNGEHVGVVRLTDNVLSFGSDVFANCMVEEIDPLWGIPIASCTMTDSVHVESMVVGDNGITSVAGRFMGDLQFCDGSTISGSDGFLDTDLFLAAFDVDNFGVLWSRNLSASHPDAQHVPALEIDANGTVWYGYEEFDNVHLISLDAFGNDVQDLTINGTRTLGGFSFDPSNNIFVSGSTGLNEGPLEFSGLTVPVPETYMMYVLHILSDGTGDWARLATDGTFSSPNVVAGGYGEAFVSGALLDSTTWGSIDFHGPDWVSDVFIVRVDAAGNFDWGKESAPAGGPISGDMRRSAGPSLACDANGTVYLTGTIRGQVDWGNGVVSDAITLGAYAQTVVAFANNGTALWEKTTLPGTINAQNVSCDEAGTVYLCAHANGPYTIGSNTTNNGSPQAFVIGRIADGSTAITTNGADAMRAFPSPFNQSFRVDASPKALIDVYDARGQRVFIGTNATALGADWASGVYAVVVREGERRSVLRVVKE